MNAKQELGKRIRALREQWHDHTGMSQSELARRTQVGRGSIIRWETGEQEPKASELGRLAAVLEVPIAKILTPDCSQEQASRTDRLLTACGHLDAEDFEEVLQFAAFKLNSNLPPRAA